MACRMFDILTKRNKHNAPFFAILFSMIQPRTLKGFRDFLPDLMLPRERLIETATDVYRSYGFCPIDTPALEYLEILLDKVWRGENTQAGRYREFMV